MPTANAAPACEYPDAKAVEFGELVYRWRMKNRLTRAKVTEGLGISSQQLYNVERGAPTSWQVYSLLCRKMGVEPIPQKKFSPPGPSTEGVRPPARTNLTQQGRKTL